MSSDGDLPDLVVGHLDAYVDSLNSLEVLLAVAHEPRRGWSLEEVAARIGVSTGAVQRELDRWVRLGFLVQGGDAAPSYVFEPSDAAREEAVRRIADAYRQRRVGVINHVASHTLKRIKTLADAFRMGRKPSGE